MPILAACSSVLTFAFPANPSTFLMARTAARIKYDGYRTRVERDGNRVRLIATAMTGPRDIHGSSKLR
jgi:hypothetical protein